MTDESPSIYSAPFRRQELPDGMPGTLVSPPDAAPPSVYVICYSPTDLLEQPLTNLDTLPELLERWPVVWVNVDGLGDSAPYRPHHRGRPSSTDRQTRFVLLVGLHGEPPSAETDTRGV